MRNSLQVVRWFSWLFPVPALILVLWSAPGTAASPTPTPPPVRTLKICVAGDTAPEIQRAAQRVLAAVATQPLLQAMAPENAPPQLTDSNALAAGEVARRAYSHLVVIGLPNDPLIQLLSQREARVENGGLYIYGWGHLRGDIGYAESARNPFLHSVEIPSIPYETEVVTLTGTTPAGVVAAVDAFLKTGLFNGVVAGPGWQRGQSNLLDRDPISSTGGAPSWVPASIGTSKRIGVISGSEDEYRGVLADAGREPLEIWRVKYLPLGGWDCDGDYRKNGPAIFEAGLHRRASGNSLWLARFSSAQEAAECMHKMAAEAKFQPRNNAWYGERPGFSKGPSAGPIALWQRGDWLLMCTLPEDEISTAMTTLHS